MFITDLIKRADLIPIIEDPSSLTPREERARDVWHADALNWYALWRERLEKAVYRHKHSSDPIYTDMHPYITLIEHLPLSNKLKPAVLELLSKMRSANLTDDAQVYLCSRILQTVRARLWGSTMNPGGRNVS